MEAGLRNNKENNMRQKAPEKKQIYVQTTDGRMLQGNAKEVINVEREVVNVEENITPLAQVNIDGNNMGSLHVNSAGNNNDQSVSKEHAIPSSTHHDLPDKAILSPVSPREQSRLQDQQLEKELNDGSDDSWSTDSQDSFVDATQLGGVEGHLAAVNNTTEQHNTEVVTPSNPIGGDINQPVAPNLIPDRVVKDMVFLKESWANMTETDAALQNVEDTSNTGDSNEQEFQLHMSKNQKKAQKKLKQSSRDSYATRSNVPRKPFR
jgi:hypothetical protein